ncbi:hypothetical protein R5W24_004436 [Gemmata sp. JC717]|uniref:hypothetical protein n=1 Tax=Gemmata algarum TaxID=2975278 RepID=UPI0021BB99E1|nr:hypothetical protein [Gemmata algarum]MDY3555295.1 hypothetical protein [Gemmata algarum]
MNLSMGLSITTPRLIVAGNPLAFLGACYALLVAYMRARGKLWQDLACTIPATEDGDPVRVAVWDFGPLGVVLWVAPSDNARPVLWDEGGGLWSLWFDGIDDQFTLSTNVSHTGTQVMTHGLRATLPAGTAAYAMGSGSAVDGKDRSFKRNVSNNWQFNGWFADGDTGESGTALVTRVQVGSSTLRRTNSGGSVSSATLSGTLTDSSGTPIYVGRGGADGSAFAQTRVRGLAVAIGSDPGDAACAQLRSLLASL